LIRDHMQLDLLGGGGIGFVNTLSDPADCAFSCVLGNEISTSESVDCWEPPVLPPANACGNMLDEVDQPRAAVLSNPSPCPSLFGDLITRDDDLDGDK
jgi:hypothetical protein